MPSGNLTSVAAAAGTAMDMPEQVYKKIAAIAYAQFGVDLRSGRLELVRSRLAKLLRLQGFSNFSEYLEAVAADKCGKSLIEMMDALTTNHTSFYREKEHFAFLVEKILPQLAARPKISIWSAAAATGEEIYTILIVLIEALKLPFPSPCTEDRIEVRGTDISTRALETARSGVYSDERTDQLPISWRKYFKKGTAAQAGKVMVRPELRRMAKFERWNLMETPNYNQKYPIIFCRNVLIYFDQPTQEKVVARLQCCLEPNGYLFIGHSETLNGVPNGLKYVGPSIYQLVGAACGVPASMQGRP